MVSMFFRLIVKNILKNKLLAFISIFAFFVVFLSSSIMDYIFLNIKNVLISQDIGKEPNKFIIKRKIGFLPSLKLGNELEKIYIDLKKDPNIKTVYGLYKTNIPAIININFFGFDFTTDVLVYATDKFSDTGDKLKIGVSSTLINIYNTQVVDGGVFPKLSLSNFGIIPIEFIFGKNSFFTAKKQIKLKGKIAYIDNDFSLFGLTIAKNRLDEISKELGMGSGQLFEIIGIVKDKNYLKIIKQKYKKFKVQDYDLVSKKIEKKLQTIKLVFEGIKYILYIILFSFIIVLIVNIFNKNAANIKVFYYHGANYFQQLILPLGEILLYIFIASLFIFLIVWKYNLSLPNINAYIASHGIMGIKLEKFDYEIVGRNIFIITFITLLFGLIFKPKVK